MAVYAYSLGNRIWEDNGAGGGVANNGLRDGSEPGLASVTVRLYQDTNNDDAADGASVANTTTDSSGYYRFDNLLPGNYIVEAVTPTGYISSTVNGGDPDNDIDNDNNGAIPAGNDIRSYALTIENTHIEPVGETDPAINPQPGESPDSYSNRTLDFSFFKPYSLGNRVWNDNGVGSGGIANDGYRNGDEPGLSGITVRLFRDSNGDGIPEGASIAFKTTDSNGYYRFDSLTADTYIVEIVPPTGFVSSTPVFGDPDNDVDDDDNGEVLSGSFIRSYPVTLGTGASEPLNDNDPSTNPIIGEPPNGYSNRTVDFGLIQGFSLGNRVWDDNGSGGGTANNGLRDGSEPGINGITVNLYLGASIIATTTTDGNGYYRFDNLITNDYLVEIILPGGYATSSTSVANPNDNIDNDNNGFSTVGNAVRSGIITLGPNGDEPSNDNDPVTNPTTGEAANLFSNRTVDFGLYHSPFSLGNRVWNDNGSGGGNANNGIRDGSEPGLSGVTVRLYKDSNDDGNPDSIIPITTQLTDANGYYRFDNLITDTYIVEVLIPTGFMSSAVNAGDPDIDIDDNDDNGVTLAGIYIRSNPVTLGPAGNEPTLVGSDPSDLPGTGEAAEGYSNRTVDFGFSPLASLGDRVWNDINRNGVQDVGELGITGVAVELYNSSGFISATATTGGGLYSFINLVPGDYYVKFTLPANYLFSPVDQGSDDTLDSDANVSTGITVSTTLLPGGNDPTWDAGMYLPPASLGDLVWNDLNRNGIQDPGELGISGVIVNLFRPGFGPDGIPATADDASVVASTNTNGSGNYAFTELIPGSYIVIFTLPGGYAFSPANQGSDDTLDSDANITTGQTNTTLLSPGENDPTWDAGIYQLASVGDRVWNDVNRNGIQDAGETGVNGVTVTLYSGAGALLASTNTTTIGGVDGLYRFLQP